MIPRLSFPDLVSGGDSPPLGSPILIFLAERKQIPTEYYKVAEMDGCGKIGIFFRIILPLIKLALFTTAIFAFYWS